MLNYELDYFKQATDKILNRLGFNATYFNTESKEFIATIIHDAYEEGIKENQPDEDYEPPEPQHNEGYD